MVKTAVFPFRHPLFKAKILIRGKCEPPPISFRIPQVYIHQRTGLKEKKSIIISFCQSHNLITCVYITNFCIGNHLRIPVGVIPGKRIIYLPVMVITQQYMTFPKCITFFDNIFKTCRRILSYLIIG